MTTNSSGMAADLRREMRRYVNSIGIDETSVEVASFISLDDRLASINANLKRIADALDRQG